MKFEVQLTTVILNRRLAPSDDDCLNNLYKRVKLALKLLDCTVSNSKSLNLSINKNDNIRNIYFHLQENSKLLPSLEKKIYITFF